MHALNGKFSTSKSEKFFSQNWQISTAYRSPLNGIAFRPHGDLLVDLELRGTPIGSLDTMIADHALSLRATLVTNNTHDFAKVSVQGKRDGMVYIRQYLQQNLLLNQ